MPALLRSDGLQNHWSFEDIKPDSQAHGLLASSLRSHRVPSMVERIIQRVRETVDLGLDVAHQHRPVAGIELRIHDSTYQSRLTGILEVVEERVAELVHLLAEARDAGWIPAHRGVRPAEGLQRSIGPLAHRLNSQEFLQNGGG